jgi:hypothetical protein
MRIATDLEMKRAMREIGEDVIHSTKAVIFWGCLSLYKSFWLISQHPMEIYHLHDEDVRVYNERVFVTRVVRGGGTVVHNPTTGHVLAQFRYPPGGVPYHLFQALVEFQMAGVVSVESRCPVFRTLLIVNFVLRGRSFSRLVCIQRIRYNESNEWRLLTLHDFFDDHIDSGRACGAVCQMMNELAISSQHFDDIVSLSPTLNLMYFRRIYLIDLNAPELDFIHFTVNIYLVASQTFIRRILLLCRDISDVDDMYEERNAPILAPFLRGITFRCNVIDHANVTHHLSVQLGFAPYHTGLRITSRDMGYAPEDSDDDGNRSGGDTDNEGVL